MPGTAIPIETLAVEDVETAVRQALSGDLQPERLADFLASVDWSNQERTPQAIRETLGALEQCATEYAEGDLTEAGYRNRLRSLLPTPAASG